MIHERPVLVPRLSVAHNLMLGREPRRYGLVDEARLELEAREHLERFGFAGEIDGLAPVEQLDVGGRQILEMMRAQLEGAEVLVLEEPAALLTAPQRDRLFGWLRSLHREGMTCIYVSDRLDEVIGLCDRVVVLRDGKTAQTIKGAPPGRRLGRGRYAIHDEIAAGGMATVHLGTVLGPFGFSRTVAIKRLHAALSRDPEFVAMFLDEARLASRIRHANVVTVLDVYAEEGELSLVMEYVDGESLARLLRLMSERRRAYPARHRRLDRGLRPPRSPRRARGARRTGRPARARAPRRLSAERDRRAATGFRGSSTSASPRPPVARTSPARDSSRARCRTWRPSKSRTAR